MQALYYYFKYEQRDDNTLLIFGDHLEKNRPTRTEHDISQVHNWFPLVLMTDIFNQTAGAHSYNPYDDQDIETILLIILKCFLIQAKRKYPFMTRKDCRRFKHPKYTFVIKYHNQVLQIGMYRKVKSIVKYWNLEKRVTIKDDLFYQAIEIVEKYRQSKKDRKRKMEKIK